MQASTFHKLLKKDFLADFLEPDLGIRFGCIMLVQNYLRLPGFDYWRIDRIKVELSKVFAF